MKKAVVIGAGIWIALASIAGLIWSPSPIIRHVSVIYLIWFIAGAINLILVITMTGALAAHRRREFWACFWISGVALVINSLVPLFLLLVLPLWTVLVVEAINLALNTGAIPFRIGMWCAAQTHLYAG